MIVRLHPDLHSVARLGVLRLDGITLPEDSGGALWQRLEAVCEGLHAKWSGTTVAEIPGVQEARSLYRAVGLDPTKTRPSSEALLRRAIKGKGLFRVHPLVDLFNLVSVTELLPVGLYDESKISGDTVTVRMGKAGWGFEGIRKGRVNVDGRLCVTDARGPFGSPTSDSLRTAIDGDVRQALAIFFQPAKGDINRLSRGIRAGAEIAAAHLTASVTDKNIISH